MIKGQKVHMYTRVHITYMLFIIENIGSTSQGNDDASCQTFW